MNWPPPGEQRDDAKQARLLETKSEEKRNLGIAKPLVTKLGGVEELFFTHRYFLSATII
jgi:hypothetical protein